MSSLRRRPQLWTHPLHNGIPPIWASEWGQDRLYGPWCSLRVLDVVQRLRWIPPGVFRMGSSEDEEERFEDEGPQHLVTIEPGFWMFDTPCTQALWEAVMGENPSDFKGPDRPVESVSWDQCQEFLKAMNSRIDGLRLSLPSEAQWEYAWRGDGDRALPGKPRCNRLVREQRRGDPPGRRQGTESLGPIRHAGECVGVVRGCLGENYPDDSCGGGRSGVRPPRDPGWLLGRRRAGYVGAAFRYRFGPSSRDRRLGFRCTEFRAGL